MAARWRKIRTDRKAWRSATTVAGLGELMASWLEGAMIWRPGAAPGLDPETVDLVPVLARANRAGFLTTDSQPGCDGPGFDGRRWKQRASVTGFVADDQMMHALSWVAGVHRLTLLIRTADDDCQPGVTVTRVDVEDPTTFGDRLSRRDLRHMWQGVGRDALVEVTGSLQVTLIDPEFGRNDRLWPALGTAIRTPACHSSPSTPT